MHRPNGPESRARGIQLSRTPLRSIQATELHLLISTVSRDLDCTLITDLFVDILSTGDREDKWWVLNIGSNHLRMIACILFSQNLLYVKHIVTHAEYDRLCDRYRRGDLP